MSSFDAFWTLVLLTTSWLTAHASEPICTHVADFDNCSGNVDNFCPKGIACGCKDQMPFCKCPFYRSQWEDYWYMGPKCEYLWSTLDLILVASLPALALSAVVAVTMQCISSCRNKPKESVKHSSPCGRQPGPPAHFYSNHAPGLLSEDAGAAKMKFPRLPLQNQLHEREHVGGFSDNHHRPLTRLAPKESGALMSWSPEGNRNGPWENEVPEADYEENPFSVIPMREFHKPGTSIYSQLDYYQHNPHPANAPRVGSPYGIGHARNMHT